jgi:hypothetical protein
MFLERFYGKKDIGDINTKDNRITNVVFVVGVVITLRMSYSLLVLLSP